MEINSKQLMIAAAIGAAAWYFLRKKPAASSGTGGANAVTSAINSLGGLFGGGNTKPLSVDIGQTKPIAAPAPAPAQGQAVDTGYNKPLPVAPAASGAVWGGTVAGAAPAITTSVTPSESYTFNHLTPEQRGNKTDGQLAMSILGY